jgi:hypothetical protein
MEAAAITIPQVEFICATVAQPAIPQCLARRPHNSYFIVNVDQGMMDPLFVSAWTTNKLPEFVSQSAQIQDDGENVEK